MEWSCVLGWLCRAAGMVEYQDVPKCFVLTPQPRSQQAPSAANPRQSLCLLAAALFIFRDTALLKSGEKKKLSGGFH